MKFLPLVVRNLLRNPLRAMLTIAAIAFAISLVSLLRTLPDGMDRMLNDFASKTRLTVTSASGLAYPLPYSHLRKISSLDDVVGAASWTWLGGAYDVDEGVTFPSFAVEPEGLAQVWPDWVISEEAHQEFARRRNGAIVGIATLERYGWEVGDLVTLVGTAIPVTLDFQIVGVIDQSQMPFFFFQREYLAQALAANGGRLDSAGLLWIRATDPPALARIQGEVEALFQNSAARAVAQTEQSFLGGAFTFLQDFLRLILGVTVLITLCVLFIAGNTASLAIQERAKETGVLRALGFPRGTILTMLLAETGLLVWVAGALGVGAAIALTQWLRSSRFAEAFPPIGSFHVDFPIIVSSLALSVAVGVVAGLVPSLNAARRQPSELLRRSD